MTTFTATCSSTSLDPTRRAIALGLLLLACAWAGMASGCAKGEGPGPNEADYTFVYLKTGPQSAAKTPEERKTIFAGHMSNMKRLADDGKLVIAGPFDKPRDKSWRGIFVMDTASVDEARSLVETDPGIIAGVFTPELRPLRGSNTFRQTLALERELNAAREANPTEPPPNIRAYVMLTTTDAKRTARMLAKSSMAGQIVWCGRFTDSAGGGVFVLDSKSVDEVRTALGEESPEWGLDGWWSTTSLEKLPAGAKMLP